MNEVSGPAQELVRFGLGARNWLLTHMEGDADEFNWVPPEDGRSAAEIVDHATWVVSAVCLKIGEDLGIDLPATVPESEPEDVVKRLKLSVSDAYRIFKNLCSLLEEQHLDQIITLPPPARLREGSVSRVLRIMAGYHIVHHAGQVALLLRRAKEELADE